MKIKMQGLASFFNSYEVKNSDGHSSTSFSQNELLLLKETVCLVLELSLILVSLMLVNELSLRISGLRGWKRKILLFKLVRIIIS